MRLMPRSWVVAVLLTLLALGWQLSYELGIRKCVRDSADLLMSCAGPLDAWVLPVTLVAASVLVAMGIWRLVPPPRD
jgi:uncharacterized membrane protein